MAENWMAEADLRVYEFGPFRLDERERLLFRAGEPVVLTDKVFELLLLLVRNPGHALSKSELMDSLWPDTAVEENNLTVNVSILRKALGEGATERRYIETLARRGYRFVAPVTASASVAEAPRRGETHAPPGRPETSSPIAFVGRDAELGKLETLLARAKMGSGRVVFVTGSAGMGKTELCEQLLARASGDENLRFAVGRCLEHYGEAEAYLPFLEIVGTLLSSSQRDSVARVLRRHAPSWCAHFPGALAGLADERGGERFEPRPVSGGSMIRELAEALEALSRSHPLVLVLEDLHWADPSSCDLLGFIAQRIGTWRALVLATYRSEQVELSHHPLKNVQRELAAHDRCDQVALTLLARSAVSRYLDERFETHAFPESLSKWITERTEGQPLFATRLVQALVERGDIAPTPRGWALSRPIEALEPGVPDTVRGLIERKFESLDDPDRQALRYASVAGVEFSSALLAGVIGTDEVSLEERLDRLARAHRLVELVGEERLTGGRITARYRFAHVLYANVLYDGLAQQRRSALHGRIAEQLIELYGAESARLAAQLATHFEAARQFEKAIEHWMMAADKASRLHADRESTRQYGRALALVSELPESERVGVSIILHYNLGWCRAKADSIGEGLEHFRRMLALAGDPAFTGSTEPAERARARVFDYFEQPWRDASGVYDMPRMPNQPRELGAAAIQCEALWGISTGLLHSGNFEEMARWTARYLEIAVAHRNEPRRVEALAWMAAREVDLRNFSEAIRLADESIHAGRAIGHDRALFIALHARARSHYSRAEYDEAEALFEQAAALTFEAQGRVECLVDVARTRAHSGRVSGALATLDEAIRISGRTEQQNWLLTALQSAGNIYLELFDWERAVAAFSQAESLAQKLDRPYEAARAAIELSAILAQRGEVPDAVKAFGRAETRLRGVERDAAREARHFEQARAEYRLATGDLDAAEHHARNLLQSACNGQALRRIAVARHLLGRVLLARGDRGGAAEQTRAGLERLGPRHMPLVRVRLLSTLAAALSEGSVPTEVAAIVREAKAIVDTIAAEFQDDPGRTAWLRAPAARSLLSFAG